MIELRTYIICDFFLYSLTERKRGGMKERGGGQAKVDSGTGVDNDLMVRVSL